MGLKNAYIDLKNKECVAQEKKEQKEKERNQKRKLVRKKKQHMEKENEKRDTPKRLTKEEKELPHSRKSPHRARKNESLPTSPTPTEQKNPQKKPVIEIENIKRLTRSSRKKTRTSPKKSIRPKENKTQLKNLLIDTSRIQKEH